jgi:hypothetical protein
MQELSIANIEIIESEVAGSGITFSHLREELVDHICCEVESYMQLGLSFEKAFEKIRNTIGNKGLKKVQEDTILLIDKKYRRMKKTMKIFGLVSLLLIAVGTLFRIQHYPGAGPMLILGFLLLGTLFLPSALWVMKKESKLKGSLFIYIISIIGSIIFIFGFLFKLQHYPGSAFLLVIGFSIMGLLVIPAILISKLRDENTKELHTPYIIGAIALIIYLAGDLFKIMHWPGAGPMLIVGAILLTTVFFPVYAYKVYRKAETIKAGFLFLCVGIVFFNMFNLLLALNVSKDVLGYFVISGKETLKTTGIIENKNNTLVEKIITDSLVSDTAFKSKIKNVKAVSDELCVFIEKIKTDLISKADGVENAEAVAKAKNPALIIAKDNYDIPTGMLCDAAIEYKDNASVIKAKIESCRSVFQKYCKSDINATKIIQEILETKSPVSSDYDGEPESWELNNYYHLVLIAVINKLSSQQRNVRFAELETLESLNTGIKETISKNN